VTFLLKKLIRTGKPKTIIKGACLVKSGENATASSLKTFGQLLPYGLRHWRGLAVVLITMLLSVGLDVLKPWPLKLLVDNVLGGQEVPAGFDRVLAVLPWSPGVKGLLVWVCVSTVLIFLAGMLMSMATTVASVAFGQRMTYDLGADLFLHLQRLSLIFHSRRSVGDTIARVTGDPYCIQVLITGVLLPLLQSMAALVTMFIVMYQLEPRMTLLALTVVPLMVLNIWLFGKRMRTRGRRRRDLEARMMSVVQVALNAIPAVQAFTREEQEHALFQSHAADTVAAYKEATLADMWFKFFVGLVTAIGTAAIMWIGTQAVLDGRITVGTILVFLAYLASLYGPLNSITYTASTLQYAAANAERVVEILHTPLDVRDLPDARDVKLRGHVCYENVVFGYEPAQSVLKGISFEAKPGEIVAIVGPSGGGKTTLANLLVRFFDPWSGRITIDGHDLRNLQVRSLRQQVAIVLQDPFIFPLSVADNIAYGRPAARREEIMAAAAAAAADHFILNLPQAFDAVVGERGATLSAGEKQRLSIARAFLKDAPILLLDEPTSALDARTERQLLDVLDSLMKYRTTFIIAHRLSTIRNANRILVIDHGEIVEHGRHEELVARNGLYASLYRQQMDLSPAGSTSVTSAADNGQPAPTKTPQKV
jgi:ATP-binding cassette subfamily B protein/subfamily B ATP-binding cassette protein MsbA